MKLKIGDLVQVIKHPKNAHSSWGESTGKIKGFRDSLWSESGQVCIDAKTKSGGFFAGMHFDIEEVTLVKNCNHPQTELFK